MSLWESIESSKGGSGGEANEAGKGRGASFDGIVGGVDPNAEGTERDLLRATADGFTPLTPKSQCPTSCEDAYSWVLCWVAVPFSFPAAVFLPLLSHDFRCATNTSGGSSSTDA